MESTFSFPTEYEHTANIENTKLSLFVIPPMINRTRNIDAPVYSKVMHTHLYHEIFLCTRGNLYINTEYGMQRLQEGDICIIVSNVLHSKLPSEKNASWYTIGFNYTLHNRKDTENLFKTFHSFFSDQTIVFVKNEQNLCNKLAEIVDNVPDKKINFPALRFISLLLEIMDISSSSPANDTKKPFTDDNHNRLRKLDYLINTHFMNNLTAAGIAEKLFISERQLERIVLKHYGTSIRNVINEKRMLVACQMLTETNMSADSIGMAVGFHSRSSFYNEFKKRYHVTPSQFRKQTLES